MPSTRSVTARQSVSAWPVIVLALTSVLFGVAIHIYGFQRNPYSYQLDWAWKATPRKLRQTLRLSNKWPTWLPEIDQKAPKVFNFVLVLLLFFQDISNDHVGQGILALMTAETLPLISFFLLETLKDGRHWLINIPVIMTVALVGQVVMLGAALPLFMIPIYAISRWSEVKTNPAIVHPLPAPAAWKVHASTICGALSAATIFWTAFTPVHSANWVNINLVFQLFPLAWLPLFFIPVDRRPSTAITSQYGSAASRQTPRLEAARMFRTTSIISVPIWYFGLYWGGKALLDAIQNNLSFKYPAVYLLFIDSIGVAIAMHAVVMIDSYVDDAKVKALGGVGGGGIKNRVHAPRMFLQDVIFGLPGLILFGPGWALSRYFQRREILAEQARFAEKVD